MKIGIVSDHRGFELKKQIINSLEDKYQILDYGTDTTESVDYPDYAFKIGEKINQKEVDFGVAICGSGIGMSIAANKRKGIRCSKVDTVNEAKLTREHNNSNVLALSALKDINLLKDIVRTYLETKFSNDERHIRRINMLEDNY